ncbi:DUF1957 domain-containing protein [bacterium]|nr:DUF1957 domain-containing protein [bacterium]
MKKKNFVLVLHCHLPYVVNHGTWPHGTDWLFEAASETYIPLLQMFDRLYNDKIPVKITANITPILLEQMVHTDFIHGYKDYLSMKIQSAINDEIYFQSIGENKSYELAFFWEEFYKSILEYFESINENMVEKFKEISDRGQLEIITCGATHGYFPLLGNDEAISGQIGTAIDTYKKYFGKKPKGFWLPENAYRPAYKWKSPMGSKPAQERKGIEEILSKYGIKYFFVDTHLIKGGEIKGVYLQKFKSLQILWSNFKKQYEEHEKSQKALSPYKPYLIYEHEENPVYVLVRDEKTGAQVWSGDMGYPGDSNYLEFHKKKFPGGHQYWKVTGNKVDLGDKLPYDINKALKMTESHAKHFLSSLENIVKNDLQDDDHGIVSLYDAELYGHWWFEGIKWIENLYREMAKSDIVRPETAYNNIKSGKIGGKVSLPEGSWGQGGFHYIWFNDWTKWTWKYIYESEDLFKKLVKECKENDKIKTKILKQMAVELLLLESSDWQFLISTWSARNYAENRITHHYDNFKKLYAMYLSYEKSKKLKKEETTLLNKINEEDDIFKNINLQNWSL